MMQQVLCLQPDQSTERMRHMDVNSILGYVEPKLVMEIQRSVSF